MQCSPVLNTIIGIGSIAEKSSICTGRLSGFSRPKAVLGHKIRDFLTHQVSDPEAVWLFLRISDAF